MGYISERAGGHHRGYGDLEGAGDAGWADQCVTERW